MLVSDEQPSLPHRPWITVVAAIGVVLVVAACGSAPRGRPDARAGNVVVAAGKVAVRVGPSAITAQEVEHWRSIFALHGTGAAHAVHGGAGRQALEFLIGSHWLVAEAAQEGMPVTPAQVQQDFREQQGTLTKREFDELLKTSHETAADVWFEAQAQLAAKELRQKVALEAPKPTITEVKHYYNAHTRRFTQHEVRYLAIAENFRSANEARRRMQQLAGAKSLGGAAFHESIEGPDNARLELGRRDVVRAIFAAKPHVRVGPLKLFLRYTFFEVTRIVPEGVKPLGEVRASIEDALTKVARRRALLQFVHAWRRRWTAVTDCRPSFVVPGCRQYAGPLELEAETLG
jgi:parvulin-like peptidyl-prolyl cis-trans isomerase-like protein